MRSMPWVALLVAASVIGPHSVAAQVVAGADDKAAVLVEKLGGKVIRFSALRGKPIIYIDLERSKVTNEQLGFLKGLKSLKFLLLSDTSVTDACLVNMSELKGLWVLDLAGTKITGSGFANLRGLNSLRSLMLSRTKVTDQGLSQITGLTGLEFLSLYDTSVTDAGLAHLRNLGSLKTLYLGHQAITDAGLVHLGRLTRLEDLSLSLTKITDAGLPRLTGLKNLRKLNLKMTGVTRDGVTWLGKRLPKASIEWERLPWLPPPLDRKPRPVRPHDLTLHVVEDSRSRALSFRHPNQPKFNLN